MSPQNRTHSQGHWFTISSSRIVAAKIVACCCIVASLSVLTGLVGCHGSVSSIPNINNAASFLVDNEVYNGPSMVSPRYGHTATTLEDGTVLIVGGSDERHLTSIELAEIFDQGAAVSLNDPVPDTGSGDFIDTDVEGNLMALTQGGRIFHTATLLPNGNVFICGGTQDALFAQAIDVSEIYDISSREFAPDFLQLNEDMITPRFRHSATLLPNGRVLVAGGQESRSETIIDPNFAPGQPGFQIDINVFPSLKSMEIFDPGALAFAPALTVAGNDPAEFLSARGRAGHNTAGMAGLDGSLGTTDDILVHAGGFQTLSTIFAPQFKLPWQQDTSNSANFEYFDATTGDNRIAAGIVSAERVNHPQIMNLGRYGNYTLEFDLDDDGEITPPPAGVDIAAIPGLTNIILIANGDNDDPACPTGNGANDLLVATFSGFGPSNGLSFTLFGGEFTLSNNVELVTFDPMNCASFSRSEADLITVLTRRTYNGETITSPVGVTSGGSFMLPTPAGCVELTQGTCANGIVGVTIYDPFYQPFLDPPWDQTGNINPITHPTGIVGSFINIDGDTANDIPDGFAEGSLLLALAQGKMLHTLNVIPGEDGVLNSVDDRIVAIGGGISYFPNYGDEPATINCEVIMLPGTNVPVPIP